MSPGYPRGLHIRLFSPLASLGALLCPNLWGHQCCRTWSQQQGNHLNKGHIWVFSAADSVWAAQTPQPAHAHILHIAIPLCHHRSCSPHTAVKPCTVFFNPAECKFLFLSSPKSLGPHYWFPVFMLGCSVPPEHLCLELHNLLGLT